MISKKAILAGLFSLVVGAGMLAMPVQALAHDHDGDRGWGQGHRDNGNHFGWFKHGDRDDDAGRYQQRGYYQGNPGYSYNHEPDADDYGYGGGYPNGAYGNRFGYPSNGQGMVNRNHPGLLWTCDSQGHHCHWATRPGYGQTGLNPFGGYYGNSGYSPYGNGYYGNNGYSPLLGLGSLFGLPTR